MQTGTVSRFWLCGRSWSWMCKKQTAVSHSSTESKIISFDTGLRLDGLPALELWDLIVSVLGNVSRVSDGSGKPDSDAHKRHKSLKRINVMFDSAQEILRIPKSECPDIWIRLPRYKWPKSSETIEGSVDLLEWNVYGQPLAGLVWDSQFEEMLLELGGWKSTELRMSLCSQETTIIPFCTRGWFFNGRKEAEHKGWSSWGTWWSNKRHVGTLYDYLRKSSRNKSQKEIQYKKGSISSRSSRILQTVYRSETPWVQILITKFLISLTWGRSSRKAMLQVDGYLQLRLTSRATSSGQRRDGY